jgi:hypothetical protein
MTEESDKSGAITDAAKAIAAITENVPVYQDAVQPAAKEVGKGLHLVAKAVNAALVPVEAFVWGVDQIREFVHTRVAKKLENVPPDEIQPPKPHIGVPTIDALRYTGSEPDLADLYANLLATSMDRATAYTAHPGFVDIIKNMCPDEARIMRYLSKVHKYPLVDVRLVQRSDQTFHVTHRHVSLLGVDSQCEHPPLASNYIDNLERLGLLEVRTDVRMSAEEPYKRIEEYPQVASILADLKKVEGKSVEVDKFRVEVTDLGKQFIGTCVIGKETQGRG